MLVGRLVLQLQGKFKNFKSSPRKLISPSFETGRIRRPSVIVAGIERCRTIAMNKYIYCDGRQ